MSQAKFLPIALALLACACKPAAPVAPASAPAAPAPAAAATAPAPAAQAVPAEDNLNAVDWFQRSAEYRASCETIYQAATAKLDMLLKSNGEDALVAEERGNAARGLKPAVVMDVDETVLDNSPYQARLVHDGKEFDDISWDAWVAERKAKAIPGAVEFAKAAAARGITVIYISNRAVHSKADTIANIRSVGLPLANEENFYGLGTFLPGCEQVGTEKLCRRKLAGQKYRVLMQFGDQLGDFVQILANTPDARQQLIDKYKGWWGERWFMLPNPTYGSWEPALFNNDWHQPREARRQAKRDALDLAH